MTLTRSLAFRLSLFWSATLFAISSIVLLLYYFSNISVPIRTVQGELREELDELEAAHRNGGLVRLESELMQRGSELSERAPFHALIDANGNEIINNMPTSPRIEENEWLQMDADQQLEAGQIDREALVLHHRMPDGSILLIGRNVEDLSSLAGNVKFTAIILVLLTLGMTIVGAFLGRMIGRRLDQLESTARNITGSNLSQRIPLSAESDEFDQFATTLNTMLGNIELAVEGLRRTSDCVAHELRMPLSRLRANVEKMQGESRPEPQAIEDALDEIDSLGRRFDAVFAIARLASDPETFAPQPTDIAQLLTDAIDLYEGVAAARRISITPHYPPGLTISGNPDLLFQAICNLLDNAVKFSPDGGSVSVSAGNSEGAVVLEIADSGPGIPAELHDLVTEKFFRAPSAVGTPGIGLGLSLVDAVSCIHKADLGFSTGDRGLTVTWSIPVRWQLSD